MGARDWLVEGWRVFSRNRLLFITGALALVAFNLVLMLVRRSFGLYFFPFDDSMRVTSELPSGAGLAIVHFMSLVIGPLLHLGYQYMMLRAVREEEASLSDMLASFQHPLSVLGATWLFSLIVAVGVLLLVVPGIVWFVKYMIAGLIVVDRGCTAFDALTESGKITKGYKWPLFTMLLFFLLVIGLPLVFLVQAVASVSPAWVLVLGTATTLIIEPWGLSAFALAYHRILEAREAALTATAPPPDLEVGPADQE